MGEDIDRQTLHAIVDMMPDAIFLCRFDPERMEGRIIYANATAQDITGLGLDEMVGQVPRDLIAEHGMADRALRTQLFEEVRRRGVMELPVALPLRVPAGRSARVRVVWPDPEQELLLMVAEILTA